MASTGAKRPLLSIRLECCLVYQLALSSTILRTSMICLLLLFIFTISCQCGRNESTDIHIIGFFPCTAKNDTRKVPVDNCDGIDRIPIVELALEEINGMYNLMQGYQLVVDYANSAVSAYIIIYLFIYYLICQMTGLHQKA